MGDLPSWYAGDMDFGSTMDPVDTETSSGKHPSGKKIWFWSLSQLVEKRSEQFSKSQNCLSILKGKTETQLHSGFRILGIKG